MQNVVWRQARVGLSFVMKIMTNVELMSSVSMGVILRGCIAEKKISWLEL